jgi:hypothetical protein
MMSKGYGYSNRSVLRERGTYPELVHVGDCLGEAGGHLKVSSMKPITIWSHIPTISFGQIRRNMICS